MTNTAMIKKQAKQQLAGRWKEPVAGILILGVAAVITAAAGELADTVVFLTGVNVLMNFGQAVSFAVGILFTILLSPLLLGYLRMMYQITKGTKPDFSQMFIYISDAKRYKAALGLCSRFILRLTLPAFAAVCAFCALSLFAEEASQFVFPISLVVFILTLIFVMRYVPAFFVYFENENLSGASCMKLGRKIYRTMKYSLTKLVFSFFFWYLLLFFVVPAIYILPYVTASVCNFSKWLLYGYVVNYGNILTNDE